MWGMDMTPDRVMILIIAVMFGLAAQLGFYAPGFTFVLYLLADIGLSLDKIARR